jgi:dipeptidyl aminopeptidase/acylaminoacyl peptidase
MNSAGRLERELTAWFADTAMQRPLDYRDDILWLTAHTSQRSRWTSLERWLPVSVVTFPRRRFAPFPWRTFGLVASLVLLLIAVAWYAGSRPRLPAPFGLAGNGLVAYAQNGDIYTVDPMTGVRQAITTGREQDREPRFSLDGTRLAFMRTSGQAEVLAIVDLRRLDQGVVTTDPVSDVDGDTVGWSHDGRSISVGGRVDGAPGLFVVDAHDGSLTRLNVPFLGLDVHWRPPDGRELMFLGGAINAPRLLSVRIDDGTVTELVAPVEPGGGLRPSGWTPDGNHILYTIEDAEGVAPRTHVVDVRTGGAVVLDVGYAHVSNGGDRILALDDVGGQMCVADIRGGPCAPIGRPDQAYLGYNAYSVTWAPNDEWILVRPGTDKGGTVVVDPDGSATDQPSWLADGGESWQRVAP